MPRQAARVVAITGASSGIGLATARLFARRGWRVGLIARGADGLDTARQSVVAEGVRAEIAVADVANAPLLAAAADRIERALGPIDVWVNDAGVGFVAPFERMTDAEFRRVTDTTYLGSVNGTRVALERMRRRNRGTIVNIGSAIAYRAIPLMTAYSGAKYAIRGFTESVRSELIHDRSNVHITMVHPPAYQPEVIAEAVYRAATTRQREIMVGAQAVSFAALNKVMPGLIDWAAGRFGYTAEQSPRPDIARRRDPAVFSPGRRAPSETGGFPALSGAWMHGSSRNRELVGLGLAVGLVSLIATRARAR